MSHGPIPLSATVMRTPACQSRVLVRQFSENFCVRHAHVSTGISASSSDSSGILMSSSSYQTTGRFDWPSSTRSMIPMLPSRVSSSWMFFTSRPEHGLSRWYSMDQAPDRLDERVVKSSSLIYFRNSSLAWREYRWAKTVKTIRKPIAEIHLVISKFSTPSSPIVMDRNSPVRMVIISGSLGFTSSNMTRNMNRIYK